MKTGNWAITCPDHKIKRSWTGLPTEDPGCPQCKLQGTKPKEPGTELDDRCKEAIEIAESIIAKVEDLPDSTEAIEFGSSIEEKARDIMATIEERHRCSDGQLQALKNMERGLDGWLNRRR